MILRICTFVATLILVGSLPAAPVQWKITDGGNDHWYEAISAPGISWSDAAAAANARGGYLATILSQEENEFVFGLVDAPQFWVPSVSSLSGPWLGGIQPDGSVEPDGGWEWLNSDGGFGVEDVGGYTNWHPPINGSPQEPNNFMDLPENALQFKSYNALAPAERSAFWNDEVGSSSLAGGYVVESLVPEPSTFLLLIMLGALLAGASCWRRVVRNLAPPIVPSRAQVITLIPHPN
jgi:hypothetical protein